jgi:hypothetical protein
MPSKIWEFVLDGEKHIVELQYSLITARERFYVDGNLLSNESRMVMESAYHFPLGSHQCLATLRVGLGSYVGELTVDGKPVEMMPSKSLLRPSQANTAAENVLLRPAGNGAMAGPDELLRPEVQDDTIN